MDINVIERIQIQSHFPGVIGHTVDQSELAWPAPLCVKKDAPNVLFIVPDDMGFGQLGCYGSPMQTLNLIVWRRGSLTATRILLHCISLLLGLIGGSTCDSAHGAPVTPDYQPPFEFTGKIYIVTVNVRGKLIKESGHSNAGRKY